MSDEAALLHAIIAQPGEDTPRLAYADWLDENEAPLQADFIRAQCALATCSSADPSYPDLVERYAELVVQFGPIAAMSRPQLPPGFAFDAHTELGADNFRRGFPYAVRGEWDDYQMSAEDGEIEQFCAGLPTLLATTTARGLRLTDVSEKQLAQILAAPGAEALTGLTVQPDIWTDGAGAEGVLRTLAGAKAITGLERLTLYMFATTANLVPLAATKFDRLAHFDLPALTGVIGELRAVTDAKWFRALRSVRGAASDRPLEADLLRALAELPHLEALDLRFQNDPAQKAFGSARGFPSLAKLELWLRLSQPAAEQLAKGRFPRLAELTLYIPRSAQLATLIKARWFPQLRVLCLRHGQLSERVVVALSKSGAAANLRILRFENVALGKKALAALGDGARFPNLTTLEVVAGYPQNVKNADTVALAKALSLPRVRHLNLSGWPLGDSGAKVLAANPALANLTRLALHECGIGETGFTALVRSPHLQQLIELDVMNNKLKTAAALRDTDLLPRLAAARLAGNKISPAAYRPLKTARGLVVKLRTTDLP